MTIKDFYLNNYPTDELGVELNEKATFLGLLDILNTQSVDDSDDYVCGYDYIYGYIGVFDSIVRERLFSELANQLNKSYDYIYQLWIK